jgi:hypothetical protein
MLQLSKRSRARRPLAVLLVAGALASAVGCATVRPLPVPAGNTFAIGGPTFGDRTLRPSRCLTGGHFVFLGAEAVDDSNQMVVRAVIDPLQGTAVRLFDDHDSDRLSVVFRRQDCTRFTVEVKPTGTLYNEVMLMALSVDLACRTRAGDTLVGSWSATECP